MTALPLFCLFVLGHLFSRYGEVAEVGRAHYGLHWLYAVLEPLVIRAADFMVESPFFTRNRVGRFLLWMVGQTNALVPHGVVIPTAAAIHIMRDIEKHSGGEPHIAVGPCVCQRVLNRVSEPACKDMTIWYGAEIYKRLFKEEYRMISADEAAAMLREFHKKGLTPVAEFCMQSRQWMFVICNCDSLICAPTRFYNAVKVALYPGPFLVQHDADKCVGIEKCGACITRCHFKANREENGKAVLDEKECMGCGLCVTTCQGRARRLVKRPGYSGRLLPWDYIKDASIDL
jgi:electron transport complex protein RnfB